MPYQHIERINLNIFNPPNPEDGEGLHESMHHDHDDEESEIEEEPEPLSYEIHFRVAPFLFYPETPSATTELDVDAMLLRDLYPEFYRVPYKDTEDLKVKTQVIAALHERTDWTVEQLYPKAPFVCLIPKSDCGTEELEIVAAMVKLLPQAQWKYFPIVLPMFGRVTEEETVEMKSEQVISDEIRDIFDVLWDKEGRRTEYWNPRIKPINNFWETFKYCQTLPDPHALNSKKMVGWKVAQQPSSHYCGHLIGQHYFVR